MAKLTDKDIEVGAKTVLDQVVIPSDASTASLDIDSSWHTDPNSIAVWGLEISEDGGATWRHWCTATRPGGPAFSDGGIPVTTFNLSAPVIPGALFRPFFCVLKGSDTKTIPVIGSLEFT